MINANRTKAGYSLVEVTLALLVVAIGLASVFALFPEAMKNTRASVDDTEVALFADYVFSTLAVVAAAPSSDDGFDFDETDTYRSMVLSTLPEYDDMVLLERDKIDQFYWIPRHENMGAGTDEAAWQMAEKAGFWTTAFTYRLTIGDRDKGMAKKTKYAMLEVWPGEWKTIADEKAFKPYVFYREILPYPNL